MSCVYATVVAEDSQ